MEEYSGPIPHPAHLQLYKEIQNDLPDRLVMMAGKDLDYRHFVGKAETLSVYVGMVFALILSVILIGYGYMLITKSYFIAGGLFSFAGFSPVLIAFLDIKRNNQ